MKSWTEPLAYGVERLDPKWPPAMTVWNVLIFHDAVASPAHWCWTSSICVASYTPEIGTAPRWSTSASVARIGPDVMTGEHTLIRFCAESMERDIACTSFSARPGQKYGRTRTPSSSVIQSVVMRPESATSGRFQSSSKFWVNAAATPGEVRV